MCRVLFHGGLMLLCGTFCLSVIGREDALSQGALWSAFGTLGITMILFALHAADPFQGEIDR